MKRERLNLSIIIPTYNEKDNILILIDKIEHEFIENKINGEIIIIDDNSKDGTGRIIEEAKKNHKNIIVKHRTGKLGLSSAVLDGFKIATNEVFCVMDADLSHPAEKIPLMYDLINNQDFDIVIGSRYIRGGKILGWNLKRKLMSKGATILARPFTRIKDPMTGFFMIKKRCIEGKEFNCKGFKILLELLIKADYNLVKEIPITFINRKKGKSKANPKEIFSYLNNLLDYSELKLNNKISINKHNCEKSQKHY
jgi:dolichol-phosphate mannosyltransferase